MSTPKLRKIEDTFSERLKMLRKARGWSQEDLALRLDVSAGSVGNWEMGPYEPHPKTLQKVASLFEVNVRFLLHGEEDPVMREQPPRYNAVDLVEILREVEAARDRMEQIAQQLRRATAKPSAAGVLTEAAATMYDQKQSGTVKNREKADQDAGGQ
jgi:transcriptional regulator with XRE-family HTH domain